MSKKVFANGMAVSCKAGDGKIIAGFPSVCLSPPAPPAGPIPVPYPCSSFSKDLHEGTKSVKIGGQPAALFGQSYFKSSPLGNEASTKSFGMSVVTHQNVGKSYFQASSLDIYFEGKKVCRHLDLTTSNHGSEPGEGPTTELEDVGYSPHQQDAKVDGKHKCECCGGQAHSQAQASGNHMTEAQFYDTANNPANAALLSRVRASKHCAHLLPRAGKKAMGCNKYYATTPPEKRNIENDWGHNAASYRRFQGVPRGSPIAHRVPKAAGGCPSGQGNLAPTGKKCEALESQLSAVQEQCASRFRT